MAFQSLQLSHRRLWQRPPHAPQPRKPLADVLRNHFTTYRSHFNDIVKLNERAPATAMTLEEWRQPAAFRSLMACYSDHIYRHQPHQPREAKPLKSLWAQWYLGLLIPPLMLALLTRRRALSISPHHIHAEFHETGRVARFWIAVEEENIASHLPLRQRLEKLILEGILPVVQTLEESGDINARLIWSNTGYLMHWFFGEMATLLDAETLAALRHACFLEKKLTNGQDNPLYRSVILQDGLLVRRTCCQRYKLPDVKRCGNCTIK